jgi:hypothetical protein
MKGGHPQHVGGCVTGCAAVAVPQVIVLSFTTIIGLMIATFWVVAGTGAIHFNDQ